MPSLNPKHIEAVIEFLNQGPFFRHLGMKITEIGIGDATVILDLHPFHLSSYGNVHSGVTSTVLDVASYWSLYSECPENAGFVTLDFKTDYLAPVYSGKLIIRGRRIKIGWFICLAEAIAVDENDKWIAHGTTKILVRPDFHNAAQTIKKVTGVDIPPKFI